MDIKTASRTFKGFTPALSITLTDGTQIESLTSFELREQMLETTDSATLAQLEAEHALAIEAEAYIPGR
jgi:hypothetical protein